MRAGNPMLWDRLNNDGAARRKKQPRSYVHIEMIKTILFSCALFQFTGVWSQCTIDQYTLTTNCAQHAPRASVTVSGGQPPYQLVFSTPDGFEYMASFPSNGTGYWSLFGAEPYGPPLSLQVTDANGCNISSLGYYDLYQSITPQVWAAYP